MSGSSAENGSSMSSTSASVAKARARPTRCCMPPESSWAYLSAHLLKPTRASFSSTILSRSALGMPRSSRPRPTFSRTVRHGSSANCWNTIATRSQRMWRSVFGSQWATSTIFSPSRTRIWPRLILFSPFTPRSSVDLPEPDNPISTQISPASTSSEQSATPSTLPVLSSIVWRSEPSSSSFSARSGCAPKTMST